MRFGIRIIATAAFAIILAPALRADDGAKSADTARKAEVVNSGAEPSSAAKTEAPAARPAPPQPAPPRVAAAPQQPAGYGTPGHSERDRRPSTARAADTPDTPKVELFLGYSYWRGVPYRRSNRIESMNGGSASLAYNFNRYVGLVADFAGFGVDSLQFSAVPGTTPSRVVDADGTVFSVLLGPRFSFRNHTRFTPFLQALGGVARASEVSLDGCNAFVYACKPLPNDTGFALTAGGGLDLRVTRHIAFRLFQVEYLLTRFDNPAPLKSERGSQNNIRLSAGVVFRFGGSPPPSLPNASPVASCSADRSVVFVGSGDTVIVSAEASDPDNDPLTYFWTTNGGAVDGNGPSVRWNSSGRDPGTYTVQLRVNDGRGGTADCSVGIRVEQRPNRIPTVSCSTDHNPIQTGESSGITADANDPDDDPLTYSYTTTGGRIAGSGPKVSFESTGLAAGSYTVNCAVSDGRGGAADASTVVEVQSPPPPPEIVELEARLGLHSIYFQTARPTTRNLGSGLVESQEKVLASLAVDFQKYLTFKPDARLILGGHADVRGTAEYNQALTQRRVERAKGFLVEHGVPPDHIETRSLGEEDELNADQVKQQMNDDPDLSPEDRQKILSNLPVIVLANNRRVDVSLSTTGQQSVRRYPFNAKDALALISTKGPNAEASAGKRPAKQ